jgi:hypothetical protein
LGYQESTIRLPEKIDQSKKSMSVKDLNNSIILPDANSKIVPLNHDKTCIEREFGVNENVYLRNYGRKEKWIPGQIVQCTGPVSYKVKTNDGLIVRRHADQLKITCADNKCESVNPTKSEQFTPTQFVPQPSSVDMSEPSCLESENVNSGVNDLNPRPPEIENPDGQNLESPNQKPLRRSSRTIKVPNKLDL